ncbi:predicted protein [Histoplasma mississippiense (nom. inval.)]|uniref:predicted protein n=1 Tax=Ajellomyces capsulatus (strain NAm1 / WU24) TaxID=2059318 RepID=UPI000157B8FA|nr:predicted protein [Histoplasma mississippiense (nom. inval.)]EDN03768.1 predicted protein [Histoplasma mississippiense (nom. inval.)]
MPIPLVSAPKIAASEMFADFSALLPTGLDDVNWDDWILFDSSPVDGSPPSLQLPDFSDDPIEAHSSPNDVANDPPNQRESTPPLVPDYREGNTSELLNYSDVIEADPHPGKEHVHAHRTEQVTLDKQEYILLPLSQVTILKLVRKGDGDEMYQIVGRIEEAQGYDTQGKSWKYSGSAEDPIIIDEPMSATDVPCRSDQFVAIPNLRRTVKRVFGGFEVHARMTLDDMQEYGGLELLADFWAKDRPQRRSRGLGQC